MKTTTTEHINTSERHGGIDVGKSLLDIYIYERDRHWQVENSDKGILAKTDRIDAPLIALFGIVMRPEIRPLQTRKVRYIRDLLARKRQLNESRTQELNRIENERGQVFDFGISHHK